ncbi:MAG TPA: hypothetical protein VLU43_10800 [Anaeromyxobacteraceae bacterium]|nr:hypothetical protein [Anaeromyxobacteraceae bacterium]
MLLLLHGLRIRTRSPLQPDPAADLFEAVAAVPDDGAAADLEIDTRLAPEGWALASRRPAEISHGGVEYHPEPDGGVTVVGRQARLRVDPAGARIDALVSPEAAGAPWEYAQVHLFAALAAALRARGRYHLHAATVISPTGRVVLAAGLGGAGKSTLAAAFVLAGHAYLGDDAVFVERREGAVRLLAFPRSFHLADGSARALLGTPVPARGPAPPSHRLRVDPRLLFPGRERAEAEAPHAILLPRVAGIPATAVERLSSAEALGGLLESSAFVVARGPAAAAHVACLAAMADGARAWRVHLGRDLLDAPAAAARRIEALTA